MSLSDLLKSRYSVRGFLPKLVSDDEINEIFLTAQRSASNCNTQPWEPIIVSGEKLKTLEGELLKAVMSGKPPNPDFAWNVKYQGVHKDRQWGQCYGALWLNGN